MRKKLIYLIDLILFRDCWRPWWGNQWSKNWMWKDAAMSCARDYAETHGWEPKIQYRHQPFRKRIKVREVE